jgi:ABC-2 type transport system ATP-binding protein
MDPVISLRNITKRYKTRAAVTDVNLDLMRGQICCLTGRPGAGKTTLLRIITGLIYPSAGTLALFGKCDEHSLNQARRKFGVLVDSPSVFEGMSVKDNLVVQGMNLRHLDKNRISELLKQLDIPIRRLGRQRQKHCTNAQRQRCGLAMALLGDPEVLILDEPFKGVDPKGTKELIDLLKKENSEKGTTVLITAAAPGDLPELSNTVFMIEDGQILTQI